MTRPRPLLRSLLLLLLFGGQASALSLMLSWDAGGSQPEPTTAEGYVLVRNGREVGRTTDTTLRDTLPGPGTYTYTVHGTANGVLSAPSNPVSVTAPPLTCTHVPTVTGFTVSCAVVRPRSLVTAQADSAETVSYQGQAARAIDGLTTTFWHTQWTPTVSAPPHTLTLDLGALCWVEGLRYLPRQDGGLNGTLTSYRIETSPDGITWTVASTGTWACNASLKDVRFAAVQARAVRLVGLASAGGGPWASAAEVDVYAVEVLQ